MITANGENCDLRGVVAIGASAGGVEAQSRLAAGLSPDVPYAYLVALHIPADAPSVLARIVDRRAPLPAVKMLSERFSANAPHGGDDGD